MKKLVLSLCLVLFVVGSAITQSTHFTIEPTLIEHMEEDGEDVIEGHKFFFNLEESVIRYVINIPNEEAKFFITDVLAYDIKINEEYDMYVYKIYVDKGENRYTIFDVAVKRDYSWGGIWVSDYYLQGHNIEDLNESRK